MESQPEVPQLQAPAAAHTNGNAGNTPSPIPLTTDLTSMTELPAINSLQKPALAEGWDTNNGKMSGQLEDEDDEEQDDNTKSKVILFVIVSLFALSLVLIGILYHPALSKTTGPEINGIEMSDTKGAITGTLTAKIPAASTDGVDIDVFMAQETTVPALKARQITPASSVDKEEVQVIKAPESSDTSMLDTLSAPPYLDACKINLDCDWGYRCIEGTCYPGCDSNSDCRHGHTCDHWKHDGPSYKYCMVKPHKECGTHLDFCRVNDDCCSGRCKSKGKWKLCEPTPGRSNKSQGSTN